MSKKEMYFSYFPENNDFEEHDTLQEAKDSAEGSLDCYTETASEGWDESVENVCYGKILGRPEVSIVEDRDNYTQEEWSDMGYSDEWDEIIDYELKDLKEEDEVGTDAYISLIKDTLNKMHKATHEGVLDLAEEVSYYVEKIEGLIVC